MNESCTFKKVWQILQLGYVIFSIATVLYKQREHMVVFLTSMGRVQFDEFPEHWSPCCCLLFCVINMWQRLSTCIDKNITWFNTGERITNMKYGVKGYKSCILEISFCIVHMVTKKFMILWDQIFCTTVLQNWFLKVLRFGTLL